MNGAEYNGDDDTIGDQVTIIPERPAGLGYQVGAKTMAQSIVDYKGRTISMKDGFIEHIICLVCDKYDRQSAIGTQSVELRQMIEWWNKVPQVCAVGCLELYLDKFADTQEKLKQLRELLDATIVHAQQFGRIISGDYFNRRINQFGEVFSDIETSKVVAQIELLLSILSQTPTRAQ